MLTSLFGLPSSGGVFERRPAVLSARHRAPFLVLGCLAVACSPPEPEPNVDTLRASFIAQIGSIEFVEDLEADGDEIRFVRPDGSGQDVDWRVRIDALEVVGGDVEGGQVAGHVLSAWSANGRPIMVGVTSEGGLVTDMPQWILDAGLAPECWALWDQEEKSWGWT